MCARWVEHSFAPHMHDFYAVSLNYGGRGAFHCRHALRDAAPGTCNFIAPGELHTGHATCGGGWIHRNRYIDTPRLTALLQGLDWQGPLEVRFKLPLASDAWYFELPTCSSVVLWLRKSGEGVPQTPFQE